MALHTQRDESTGLLLAPTSGLQNELGGFGCDTSFNPQIRDKAGNVVAVYPTAVYGTYMVKLSVAGTSSSSGVFASLANPFGANAIILGRVLNATTQSTGAATVDIGVAADATTSSDTLMDGQSVATAGALQANGTNGLPYRAWSTTQFVNVAEASGDVDGLVGTLYLLCALA